MSWSWRIATVSGIAIRIHVTFLAVVALGAAQWGVSHGARGAVFGAVLVCCLFLCVALHELGHSLVAQRLGVSVREILLLPIGGIARLGREPKTALHELLIAVAGPAVNVLIAVVLTAFSVIWFGPAWLLSGEFAHSLIDSPSFTTLLVSVLLGNVVLAVFNMIPALPMDGGRVFRALLTFPLGKYRATMVAAFVGQMLAGGAAAFGVLKGHLILALIGAFVFMGAAQERAMARLMAQLAGLKAGDAVDPRAIVLEPGDVLGLAMEYALRTPQAQFAVVLGDRVLGAISRDQVLRAVRRLGPYVYVAQIMERDLEEVDAATELAVVRNSLIERGGKPLLVRSPNGVVGLIGLEDVARAASMADLIHQVGGASSLRRSDDVIVP